MYLMRTQKKFVNRRCGLLDEGQKRVYDVDGETILDEKTGEFLGGLVIFRDVTDYANTISKQQHENEKQFEDITNMIPVMIW